MKEKTLKQLKDELDDISMMVLFYGDDDDEYVEMSDEFDDAILETHAYINLAKVALRKAIRCG